MSRVSFYTRPYDRLEPYDGKLSRTVLRGGAGSNASLLPDIHSEKDILKLTTTLIADTKESYYDALAAAEQGWHTSENDPKPFIKYMMGVILSCYREFENRINTVWKAGAKSTSYDIVREYVLNKIGTFTKQEALAACPSLGSSSVESALKKLVADGTIAKMGAGRKTHYVRSDALK